MLALLLALAPQAATPGDVVVPPFGPPVVLTTGAALHRVEGVTGRARATSDVDGDGLADLVVERGGDRSRPYRSARLELVSTRTGATLRVLHEFADAPPSTHGSGSARARQRWDLGGDANGDGTPDGG